jgi:hypothetical protein
VSVLGLPPENIPLKKGKNQSNNCSADNIKKGIGALN